jgi:hypothetical protein
MMEDSSELAPMELESVETHNNDSETKATDTDTEADTQPLGPGLRRDSESESDSEADNQDYIRFIVAKHRDGLLPREKSHETDGNFLSQALFLWMAPLLRVCVFQSFKFKFHPTACLHSLPQ